VKVLCLFVWSPEEEGDDSSASWAPGGASRVWLHHSLASMDRDIRRRYGGGGVRFIHGAHAPAVAAAAAEVNATTVFASERYEPVHVQGDERTRRALAAKGIELVTLPGHLLFHRDKIRVDMEREKYFFGTLMPFVHAAEKCGGKPGAPAPAPPHAPIAETPTDSSLDALGLIPASDAKLDWSSGIRNEWDVSEAGAAEAWAQFRRVGLAPYEDGHGRSDLTHKSSTSVLSPYLRFGQISPRRMYSELREPKFGVDGVEGRRLSRTFWHRLYRREFAYWQLGVFPELATTSWRSHYENRSDWRWPESDENALEDLRRWRRGETGFPIVDAGMRRLIETGWMHQTERMLAATFLVDYLGIHWRYGARWFHDHLVDADLAINSMMWQNAGKSGLDQWDVFSGTLVPDGSVRTHDPTGEVIARYVPELAGLPPGHLRHRPWEASAKQLAAAGVTLGETYPTRVPVDVVRMRHGVGEVRAGEVARAAAEAAAAGSSSGEVGEASGRRTDVLVDVFTGADYVVAPPGVDGERRRNFTPAVHAKGVQESLPRGQGCEGRDGVRQGLGETEPRGGGHGRGRRVRTELGRERDGASGGYRQETIAARGGGWSLALALARPRGPDALALARGTLARAG
jgi:deoxyribodipyrimidine photolyase